MKVPVATTSIQLRCCRCKAWKAPCEFSPAHRRIPMNKGRVCTECNRATVRAWEKANPEKLAAKRRRYYARHPGLQAEQSRERRAKMTPEQKEKNRQSARERYHRRKSSQGVA